METLWWLVGKFFWLMAILMGLTSFYCLIRLKLLTFVKLAFFASLALGIESVDLINGGSAIDG